MQPFAFYPVFFGTILSIVSLSLLTRREYQSGKSVTLSHLGGSHKKALQQFRAILWVCGTLFSMTVLFFISPRINSRVMLIVWTMTYFCEIMLGAIPDHKGWRQILHKIFAYGMGLGFLIAAVFFSIKFDGVYGAASWIILLGMLIAVITTIFDRKRFLLYELIYIYLSHIGIVIATLAVR